MDRKHLKSDYCTRKAEDAFADLVSKVKARYIILTYNNMAEKGNDRSNAKLSDEAIFRISDSPFFTLRTASHERNALFTSI